MFVKNKKILLFVLFAVMIITLTINYSFTGERSFQADSESLVVGSMLYAEQNDDIPQYGLFDIKSADGNGAEVHSRILSNQELHDIELTEYKSQVGLQGFVFILLSRAFNTFARKTIFLWVFRIMCAGALAVVLSAITYLISKKYNVCLAVVFFATFFLSPWIRNFGANLYWVAFTWFIPMALGLIISLDYQKYDKWWMYVLIALSIALKCLCGYEYISTIMMGLIMFALADLCIGEKKERKHIFTVIIKMGISAIFGFAIVLIIHAYIRGNGTVGSGLQSIWQTDVLRRTLGGNPSDFSEAYCNSLEASIFDVIIKYFKWNTQILDGVPGFLFIPLILIALCFYTYRIVKHKNCKFEIPLMLISCIASLSWFALGKSHSYIHTHLNFVLWYFGFIQMCIYPLVISATDLIRYLQPHKRISVEK